MRYMRPEQVRLREGGIKHHRSSAGLSKKYTLGGIYPVPLLNGWEKFRL